MRVFWKTWATIPGGKERTQTLKKWLLKYMQEASHKRILHHLLFLSWSETQRKSKAPPAGDLAHWRQRLPRKCKVRSSISGTKKKREAPPELPFQSQHSLHHLLSLNFLHYLSPWGWKSPRAGTSAFFATRKTAGGNEQALEGQDSQTYSREEENWADSTAILTSGA